MTRSSNSPWVARISPRDLTIVFGGPIFVKNGRNLTASAVRTARQYFPGAKLILATHTGLNSPELEVDATVHVPFRVDGFEDRNNTKVCHLNNMIATSKLGLEGVTTKYVAKIRTDMRFINANLLKHLAYSTQKLGLARMAGEGRILFSNLTAVNANYLLKLPHHPCDNFQAGLADDMKKLWSCPFLSSADMNYFRNHFAPGIVPYEHNLLRFRGEAWIWKHYVGPMMVETFEHSYDARREVVEESNDLFARNAVFLSAKKLGVSSMKNLYPLTSRAKMISHWDWVDLCEKVGVPAQKSFDWDSLRVYLFRKGLNLLAAERRVLFR